MSQEELRQAALRNGYRLTPIPPTALWTLEQVRQGLDTSSKIARRHGLLISTASMRLKSAETLGLLVGQAEPGSQEIRYRPAAGAPR